jgi:L-fuculose-phosphate aldolase
LVEVDLAGKRQNGYRDATTELDLHLRVYRQQKQCGAVVHAHPPTATAFAVAGEGLPVLANHGALTWGQDLTQARIRMESLEHAARILLAARALGRVSRLTREQIDALERMRGPSFHGQNDLGY